MFMNRKSQRSAGSVLAALVTMAIATAGVNALAGDKADESSKLDEMILHSKVRLALLENIGGSALGIDIDVHGHDVTLSGKLDEREHEELAAKYAKQVEGVKNVDNDLEWKQAEGKSSMEKTAMEVDRELEDSVLAARVKLALFGEIGADALGVEVEAAGDTVTLSGEVESETERETAVATARDVDGVGQVEDLLSKEMVRKY
jgi:osmotically-inducible protein OsmY